MEKRGVSRGCPPRPRRCIPVASAASDPRHIYPGGLCCPRGPMWHSSEVAFLPLNPQKRQKILGFRPSAAVVADPPLPCSHLPPLCTAGTVRLWTTFEHAAGWMRAREEQQQARVWGKVGSTPHSLRVRRGCTWGQRSSQRADAGEPWAHRAMCALACPTARGGWHVVAICGRPGHICARIRVGGAALLRLRAGWDRGQPEYTPSSHAPLDWYGSLVRAVHRVCAWTRNDTRDM